MKNKRLLFIIFILTSSLYAKAQIPFVPNSFNTESSESAYQFCESLSKDRYLFIGNRADQDSSCFIFLTDIKGNIIKHKFLDTNKRTLFSYVHADVNNGYRLFGSKITNSDSLTRLYYCQIDSNLNIISQKQNVVIDKKFNPYKGFNFSSVLQGNNVYCIIDYTLEELDSSTIPPYAYKVNCKWIKQNINGDTVKVVSTTESHQNPDSWIVAGAKKSELLYNNSKNKIIIKIDTNLEFVKSSQILQRNIGVPSTASDTILFPILNHTLEVNQDIVFIGTRYTHFGPGRPAVGLSKYNMTSNRLESINSFPFIPSPAPDQSFSVSFPGLIKHNNAIYFTNTLEGPDNTIVVGKHDSSGKCIWIRYLNPGKQTVRSNAIFGTSDKGIIILAYSDTAYSSDSNNTDFLIIKLNEDGFPLSIVNISDQLRSNVIVYPNPADDAINIKGAAMGSTITIINSFGQVMMSKTVKDNIVSTSTKDYPCGNYIYSITDKSSHRISSGNFIKQ